MFTFLYIFGVVVGCIIGLALWGAYDIYKDLEQYKPYYDGRDEK